ncbi:MAG TPA: hypothetical protein VLG17_22065, partial [Pseudomonas sp.]|nr:hypothetical protein [Pseudomonas sp.]
MRRKPTRDCRSMLMLVVLVCATPLRAEDPLLSTDIDTQAAASERQARGVLRARDQAVLACSSTAVAICARVSVTLCTA